MREYGEPENSRRPREPGAEERGLVQDLATTALEAGVGGAAWKIGTLGAQDAWDKIKGAKQEESPIILPPGVKDEA